MKTMNIFKTLIISILGFTSTTEVFSSPVRAEVFSRANCTHPVAFNESISYDATTGRHKEMRVTTIQERTCGVGEPRTTSAYQPNGYRARAGFVDTFDKNLTMWNVVGKHSEVLDNGTIVNDTSSATDCNLKLGQWL